MPEEVGSWEGQLGGKGGPGNERGYHCYARRSVLSYCCVQLKHLEVSKSTRYRQSLLNGWLWWFPIGATVFQIKAFREIDLSQCGSVNDVDLGFCWDGKRSTGSNIPLNRSAYNCAKPSRAFQCIYIYKIFSLGMEKIHNY
jgi:hypothetical protein